ncbi:hypothetical protein EGR_11063 [Echinococcus granulosus]|uniref:Uncharacterized protein n=1 Tax=Echinococcus granulosus TaxID=6210 RepID=W6TZC6_ECHGR|nr:hypothetical protein EGR_11063 [Echinococcus granulosus]EUB54078.1 hypothetical protein EGR_11063 [Echinococcus granulosus]
MRRDVTTRLSLIQVDEFASVLMHSLRVLQKQPLAFTPEVRQVIQASLTIMVTNPRHYQSSPMNMRFTASTIIAHEWLCVQSPIYLANSSHCKIAS